MFYFTCNEVSKMCEILMKKLQDLCKNFILHANNVEHDRLTALSPLYAHSDFCIVTGVQTILLLYIDLTVNELNNCFLCNYSPDVHVM